MDTLSVDKLCKAWYEAGSAVFLTGAGVSTESGLMDFANDGAEYGGTSSQEMLSRELMMRDPELFQQYCYKRLYAPQARPNIFHQAVAEWEDCGLVSAVITQNIDSLHQKAGSSYVLEVHGSMRVVRCDSCGKTAPSGLYFDRRRVYCPHCKGIIRPDILLYGEPLNQEVVEECYQVVDKAPMLIVAGTRVAVTVARDIIERFRRHPGIVVYMGDTLPETVQFDIVIKGKLGGIVKMLQMRMR